MASKNKLENIVEAVRITAPSVAGGVLGFYLSKNPQIYNNSTEELFFRMGCTLISAGLFAAAYKVVSDIVQARRSSRGMIKKIYWGEEIRKCQE
ncbi:MAG: hypothetical protein V1886_02315 [archaeon]